MGEKFYFYPISDYSSAGTWACSHAHYQQLDDPYNNNDGDASVCWVAHAASGYGYGGRYFAVTDPGVRNGVINYIKIYHNTKCQADNTGYSYSGLWDGTGLTKDAGVWATAAWQADPGWEWTVNSANPKINPSSLWPWTWNNVKNFYLWIELHPSAYGVWTDGYWENGKDPVWVPGYWTYYTRYMWATQIVGEIDYTPCHHPAQFLGTNPAVI